MSKFGSSEEASDVHGQSLDDSAEDSDDADVKLVSDGSEDRDELLWPFDSKLYCIDKEDPVMLGWPGERPTWSYGVAQEAFNGETTQIRVHHYSFDAESQRLMPSWLTPKDLVAYEDANNVKAPKEKLALMQPDEHVAFITPVDVEDVLLACPNTAALDLATRFLSELQHATARHYIQISENVACFGTVPGEHIRKKRKKTRPTPQRVYPLCIEDLRNGSRL